MNLMNEWVRLVKESCDDVSQINEIKSEKEFVIGVGEILNLFKTKVDEDSMSKPVVIGNDGWENKLIVPYIKKSIGSDVNCRMVRTFSYAYHWKVWTTRTPNPKYLTAGEFITKLEDANQEYGLIFVHLTQNDHLFRPDENTLKVYDVDVNDEVVMIRTCDPLQVKEYGDSPIDINSIHLRATEKIDNGGKESINENNDIPGKRYDWVKDFEFTRDVVEDLRKRDCFGIGTRLQIMVPVNRDDAPLYYQKGGGVIDNDGKIHKYDPQARKGTKVPAERHDFEPYDILHLDIQIKPNDKTIEVDRFYGHRTDWNFENHTNTERDWTDIPVCTEKTVKSALKVFEDRGVCENMLKLIKDRFNTGMSGKSKYIDAIYTRCQKVASGEYKTYSIKFNEPEEPTQEYIRKRANDHNAFVKATDDKLMDYYNSGSYTGD